jgi:hypothetical protein
MFDDDDSATWPLVAFVLGGLTGLSLAVLFAPAPGAEARTDLSRRTARARAAAGRQLSRGLRRRQAAPTAADADAGL